MLFCIAAHWFRFSALHKYHIRCLKQQMLPPRIFESKVKFVGTPETPPQTKSNTICIYLQMSIILTNHFGYPSQYPYFMALIFHFCTKSWMEKKWNPANWHMIGRPTWRGVTIPLFSTSINKIFHEILVCSRSHSNNVIFRAVSFVLTIGPDHRALKKVMSLQVTASYPSETIN